MLRFNFANAFKDENTEKNSNTIDSSKEQAPASEKKPPRRSSAYRTVVMRHEELSKKLNSDFKEEE